MNKEIELQQTSQKQQNHSNEKQRQLNNVKVEYYNYNVGFSWKGLFSWNNENQSFDKSKHPENKKKK